MQNQNQDNILATKQFFEAVRNGEPKAAMECLADDIVFHVPGTSQLAGDYVGREKVMGFLKRTHELSGGTFKPEVRGLAGNGDKVMVLQHVTGERNGITLDMDGAFVIRLQDGQWKEVWAFHFDEPAAARFWG